MKQPAQTSIGNASTTLAAKVESEPNGERDLQWVDEVAALLPEESRLGWYRNIRPWLRTLPPDDEVAHLAYSMGYLALLTRSTPALVAAERVHLTALLRGLTDEITESVKTAADYHQKLNYRLCRLPAEIAQGLSPDALAAQIATGVREQFLNCGVPEAGTLLKEHGERFRRLAAAQAHILAEFRQQLNDSRSHVTGVLASVAGSADAAKNSIDLWNREMRQVQWVHLGLVLLIGVLLGALLYWWVLVPQEVAPSQHVPGTRYSQPSTAVPAGRTRHDPK